MDTLEMAKALFGGGQQKSGSTSGGQTTTAYGTAVSDSADGIVMVDFGGETTSLDDEQAVEVETTFAVYEGDEVIVSLVGADGTGKRPVIIGVVGRGDQMQTEIKSVTNYFWHDAAGAHVSTQDHSVAGNNVLLDSDSLDIRFGNSDDESDQTVLASFGQEVTVGSRQAGTVGQYSQVYGFDCYAGGAYSHCEGLSNAVAGDYSHCEGRYNDIYGDYSHCEGSACSVTGNYSHCEGGGTFAGGDHQHVQGKFNVHDTVGTYQDIIGNGTNVGGVVTRSNAYNLDWNGNAEFQGEVYVGGCTPNGETPYPVVRYNTSASQSEYYDGATWTQVPGGGGGGGHNYQTRSVTYSASINAGAVSGTNLKTLIDDDLPAGWSFFTISGTATNSGNGLVQSCAYLSGNATLRVRNLGTTTATINTTIYYIAVED